MSNIVFEKYKHLPIYLRAYAYKDEPMSDEHLYNFYKNIGFEDDPTKPKMHLIRKPH